MRTAKEWSEMWYGHRIFGAMPEAEEWAHEVQRDALLHAAAIAEALVDRTPHDYGTSFATDRAQLVRNALRDLAEGKPLPRWLAERMAP